MEMVVGSEAGGWYMRSVDMGSRMGTAGSASGSRVSSRACFRLPIVFACVKPFKSGLAQ